MNRLTGFFGGGKKSNNEDGIRDFCLSRGLGDVYKRQQVSKANLIAFMACFREIPLRMLAF